MCVCVARLNTTRHDTIALRAEARLNPHTFSKGQADQVTIPAALGGSRRLPTRTRSLPRDTSTTTSTSSRRSGSLLLLLLATLLNRLPKYLTPCLEYSLEVSRLD